MEYLAKIIAEYSAPDYVWVVFINRAYCSYTWIEVAKICVVHNFNVMIENIDEENGFGLSYNCDFLYDCLTSEQSEIIKYEIRDEEDIEREYDQEELKELIDTYRLMMKIVLKNTYTYNDEQLKELLNFQKDEIYYDFREPIKIQLQHSLPIDQRGLIDNDSEHF